MLDSGHFNDARQGLGDTLTLDTTHLRGCLQGPFVTLSKGEGCWGWGTRRYCQADVDSSTSLRMTWGCAQNDYGLAKAARDDENGALPGGWELYMSSVPSPAPRPHGYRLSPVRRCGGCPGHFHTNHPCRLSPAPPIMKMGRSPGPRRNGRRLWSFPRRVDPLYPGEIAGEESGWGMNASVFPRLRSE